MDSATLDVSCKGSMIVVSFGDATFTFPLAARGMERTLTDWFIDLGDLSGIDLFAVGVGVPPKAYGKVTAALQAAQDVG